MWSKYAFDNEWKGRTAGGCPNFPSWQYNPQVRKKTNTKHE
jgi:hypothetical protein